MTRQEEMKEEKEWRLLQDQDQPSTLWVTTSPCDSSRVDLISTEISKSGRPHSLHLAFKTKRFWVFKEVHLFVVLFAQIQRFSKRSTGWTAIFKRVYRLNSEQSLHPHHNLQESGVVRKVVQKPWWSVENESIVKSESRGSEPKLVCSSGLRYRRGASQGFSCRKKDVDSSPCMSLLKRRPYKLIKPSLSRSSRSLLSFPRLQSQLQLG